VEEKASARYQRRNVTRRVWGFGVVVVLTFSKPLRQSGVLACSRNMAKGTRQKMKIKKNAETSEKTGVDSTHFNENGTRNKEGGKGLDSNTETARAKLN